MGFAAVLFRFLLSRACLIMFTHKCVIPLKARTDNVSPCFPPVDRFEVLFGGQNEDNRCWSPVFLRKAPSSLRNWCEWGLAFRHKCNPYNSSIFVLSMTTRCGRGGRLLSASAFLLLLDRKLAKGVNCTPSQFWTRFYRPFSWLFCYYGGSTANKVHIKVHFPTKLKDNNH